MLEITKWVCNKSTLNAEILKIEQESQEIEYAHIYFIEMAHSVLMLNMTHNKVKLLNL